MSYRGINDYEIIYLMQTYPEHEIINLLVKKYQNLIYKNIHLINAHKYEIDDFFQEGIITLHQTVLKFDEIFNKSFTRFFELILKRHLRRLKSKNKLVLFEDYSYIDALLVEDSAEEKLDFLEDALKNELELVVYERYFILGHSVTTISKQTNFKAKQIYNAIYRIKDKYKKLTKDDD